MVGTQESDFGTPETQYHGGGITKGYNADGAKVAMLLESSHLSYLLNRGNISSKQATAGEYFFRDAVLAGKVPYAKSCCDREVRSNTGNISDFSINASLRLEKAMRTLDSKEYDLVFRVVIKGEAVGAIHTKWRQARVDMQILCGALDSLIKFYGL